MRLRWSLVEVSADKWKIDKSAGQASLKEKRRVRLGGWNLGEGWLVGDMRSRSCRAIETWQAILRDRMTWVWRSEMKHPAEV